VKVANDTGGEAREIRVSNILNSFDYYYFGEQFETNGWSLTSTDNSHVVVVRSFSVSEKYNWWGNGKH